MQGILLKGDRQTVFRMEDAVHEKIVTSYLKRNDKRGLQKQEKTREHSGRKRGKHLTCTAVGILFMASHIAKANHIKVKCRMCFSGKSRPGTQVPIHLPTAAKLRQDGFSGKNFLVFLYKDGQN